MRLFFFFLALLFTTLAAADEDRQAVDYLKSLDLETLPSVELTLDDAFDVFDGLVQKRSMSAAGGFEQSLSRSPAVGTVITAQDIEAMGARTLDEALRAVPGLHVMPSNSAGMPLYVMRGIYTPNNPEILILLNGLPVKRLENNAPGETWQHIPVQSIARIEVVRGPGSALYGADAFAGVIDIITKSAADIAGSEIGARLGSFDTQETWLLHADIYGGWESAVMLEYYRTGGYDGQVDYDLQSAYDAYFGTQASHAPGPLALHGEGVDFRVDTRKAGWRLHAAYQGRYDLGTGNGVIEALDPKGYWEGGRLDADATYHAPRAADYWDIETRLAFSENRQKNALHPLPAGAGNGSLPAGVQVFADYTERQSEFRLNALYSGWTRHLWRLGGGFRYAELSEVKYRTNFLADPTGYKRDPRFIWDLTDTLDAILPEKGRGNFYLFAQDTWRLAEQWEFTGGLRYDHFSAFGDVFNPRLALVWQPDPEFSVKFLYGRAFRAPSFAEMYMRNTSFLSNPDLSPEILDSGEIALEWRINPELHLSINLFAFQSRDKIILTPLYVDTIGFADAYENAGRWRGHGAEFEMRWKLSPHSALLFNYAWADAQNQDSHESIEIYPHHQAYLRHDWLIYPDWYLDTQLHWTADRRSASGSAPAADYWLSDLTLRYKSPQRQGWSFALGVRNVFDKTAYARANIPLPGRNLFAEGRLRF